MGGKSDQVKGRVKEAVGSLTDDKALKAEGKTDRVAGEIKEKVEDAKGKVESAIDKSTDALKKKKKKKKKTKK